MKRTALNLLIDLVAATSFVGMLATGYILHFPLPPGTNKSLSLWGLTRHQWGEVHFWISLGLLAIVLTHVALHWQWVVTVIARQLHLPTNAQDRQLRTGAFSLLIVTAALGLFAWVAEVSVRNRDEPCCPPDEARESPAPNTRAGAETRPGSKNGHVDFWNEVYPVLEASCLSCHGPGKARAGFRVDRRDDFFRTDRGHPFIVRGNSAASPLVTILSGGRPDMAMLDRHRLPEKDLTLIKNWIDAGAPWPNRREAIEGSKQTQRPPFEGDSDADELSRVHGRSPEVGR